MWYLPRVGEQAAFASVQIHGTFGDRPVYQSTEIVVELDECFDDFLKCQSLHVFLSRGRLLWNIRLSRCEA